MDELVGEFLAESRELLTQMEACLTRAEPGVHDAASVAEIFRAVHTIKGSAGFLALARVERLAHAGEDLMASVRTACTGLREEATDALLALVDTLREALASVGTEDGEPESAADGRTEAQDHALIARLRQCVAAEPSATAARELAPAAQGDDAPGDRAAVRTIEEPPITLEAETTVRLDVGALNRMLALVSELVLTRNAWLAQRAAGMLDDRLLQRLDSTTTQLREAVMQARLQPVSQLFGRMPRLVRSLAAALGREVRLVCTGMETGLDRSMMDALRDPLVHAMRNAIDHGIEPPEQRVRAGKPRAGTLRLAAWHERGEVTVELRDDGAGVDLVRVRDRAVARGLLPAERAAQLTPAQTLELLFAPGFSTRDDVSMMSGRGVGLDVVRANVEAIGGTVQLHSVAGEGTTLSLRVPLTLAISQAMVLLCGGQLFALPQNAVCELLVVPRRAEASLMERVGDACLLRLRGQVLPLLRLADVLELAANEANGYYVLVLESRGRRFALVVDDLRAVEEIVIRPLPPLLRACGCYAGLSLLGCGDTAMVLEPAALAVAAGLAGAEQAAAAAMMAPPLDASEAMDARTEPALMYTTLTGERHAMPLTAVHHVVNVAPEAVTWVQGRALLRLRLQTMPLAPGTLVQGVALPQHMAAVLLRGVNGEATSALLVQPDLQITDAAGAAYADTAGEVRRVGDTLVAWDSVPHGAATFEAAALQVAA